MANKRLTMVINGAQRSFVCDPEETLATVIRRMGLTGTKVGCGAGQCGACELLVDGKVVRSCTKKMKSLPEYSEILTIEGIGTAQNLHPLQKAWIAYGGVQCGFCTPGFIMSAYALLQENSNPTRDEARAWFQKNRNACRCTGYKPIIDAVMAAAKVVRGEWTMADLDFKMPEDGKIYNTRYPRPAALSKVLGAADYGDDVALKMGDVLHAAVVMPGVYHANINGIDTSEAEKAPGVVKVVTAKDVKGINRITFPMGHPRAKCNGFERHILADDKIRYYGDIAAVVVADTREHAREAAKLVKLDLETLPAYLTAVETFADDAVPIHDGIPPVYMEVPVFYGNDPRDEYEKAAYTAEGSFFTSRQPHIPIEPETIIAYVENGIVTIQNKVQYIDIFAPLMAAGIGVPPEQIRIIENPSGGSFGSFMDMYLSSIMAVVTMSLDGKAVSLTPSYEESTHIAGKRLPCYINAKMACDENGIITATHWEGLMDKGAYTPYAAVYPAKIIRFYGMPYKIPNAWGWGGIASSTHAPGMPYRGAGSPQTQHASEQLMDMLAEQIGMDPFEIRYKNVLREGDKHYNGHGFSTYSMTQILDTIRPKYEAAKERAKTASTDTVKRGVGICCAAFNSTSGPNDVCTITVELNEENGLNVYSNWQDVGQGGDIGTLTNVHEAFRPLGLKPEQIKLRMNDSALPSNHGASAGSRSHYMDGKAAADAAEKLLALMKKPDGTFRTYEEMKAEGIETAVLGIGSTQALNNVELDPNTGQGDPTAEYMWAAFVSEVDVDITTGKAKVVSMHCVADVGVVGNYLAVDGQAYGGMSHCIGFALTEDYSDALKHKNVLSLGIPYAEDVPDGDNFTVEYIQTPRPSNPFGSSGCSEIFQSSEHVAVLNAIYNAVGVRIYEIPATPEKIKAGIDLVARGKKAPAPDPYWFGSEFFERMEDIKANPVAIPEG